MRLVKLTYFNNKFDHPATIMINPDHVVFLLPAEDGAQTWLQLVDRVDHFLVQGSIGEVAAKLQGDYDLPPKQRSESGAERTGPFSAGGSEAAEQWSQARWPEQNDRQAEGSPDDGRY